MKTNGAMFWAVYDTVDVSEDVDVSLCGEIRKVVDRAVRQPVYDAVSRVIIRTVIVMVWDEPLLVGSSRRDFLFDGTNPMTS